MSDHLFVLAVWLLIGCLLGGILVWRQHSDTPSGTIVTRRATFLTFALAVVLWLPAFVVGVWFYLCFWDLLPYFEEEENRELKRTSQ